MIGAEQLQVSQVAIYIRWSTEDQGEGTTLEVQMDACKSYILSQGWAFRDDLIFVDDGISGATLERPALSRLRGLVQQGGVDCVVVYKLDRLSRTVLDMLKLVLEEWDSRCHIKSAREPIDTLTPTGKMFFYQLMSFAEWERSVIRERTMAGRLRRAQEGKNPGLPLPYGYVKGADGAVAQDPARAAGVRRMYELYLGGMGFRLIAKTLQQEGYPVPKGDVWSQPSVADMMRNPAYMGTMAFGRNKRGAGGKKVARQPLVVHEHFFPAIVTREVFEAAQKLRAERPGVQREKGTGRTLGSQSLLTGLLRCKCGAAATGKVMPKSNGTIYRYYLCGSYQHGALRCQGGNIRQEDLDNLVVGHLLGKFRGEVARSVIMAHLEGTVLRQHQESLARRKEAEDELRRLHDSEKRLKGLFLEAQLTVEEYRQLQAELNTKLMTTRGKLEKAVAAEIDAKTSLQSQTQNTVLLDRIEKWEELPLRERKQLIGQFVDSVTAYRDKSTNELTCEITWRWAPPEQPVESFEVVNHPKTSERSGAFARSRTRGSRGRFLPCSHPE